MTANDMMTLRALLEQSSDADLLREMIGFTAERLMALEVNGLTGAGVIGRFVPRITVTTKNDLRSMWWRFSKLLFLRRRSALTLDRTRSRPR